MADERPWTVRADAAAMKADPETAGYILRLGIAATAIRAAYRLTIAVKDLDGPSDSGTRLWSFLMAIAYLHETGVTAQSGYPKLKRFALAGGASQNLLDTVGQTFAGNTDVGRAMARIRNSLVFHFDGDAAEQWVKAYDKQDVVWAEGLGRKRGNTLYRASTDVVAANILPDVEGDGRTEYREFLESLLKETGQILELLEHAIAGYVNSIGATVKHGD